MGRAESFLSSSSIYELDVFGTIVGHSREQISQKSALTDLEGPINQLFLFPACVCVHFLARYPETKRDLFAEELCCEHFISSEAHWILGIWN